MIKKIKSLLIKRISYSIFNQNIIEGNVDIEKSAILKQVHLTGDIAIEEGCKLINGIKIISQSNTTIGRYTSLNGPNFDIHCSINGVRIGSFCSLARGVSIQEYNHISNRMSTYYINQNLFDYKDEYDDITSKGPIIIGNDVWVGVNTTILSGVTIGDGVIIGANSVVTRSLPDYSIAAGNPARVIKYRFDKDIILKLKKISWWDWELNKIKKNKRLFNEPITENKLDEFIN